MGSESNRTSKFALPRLAAAALACAALLPANLAQAQAAVSPSPADVPPADPLDPKTMDLPQPPADVSLPKVEPVIPDAEFESLIPEFDPGDDPALAAPLESIDEFERRLAGESDGTDQPKSGTDKLAGSAQPDKPSQAAVGEAPLGDPELLAPLPPLESFDSEPAEFAGAGSDKVADTIEYKVELVGLDQVETASDANMAGLFRSLSTLRAGGGKAANISQVRARLSEDSELLRTILESEGWYDAQITSRMDMATGDGPGKLTAVISVVPGQRFTFGEIVIDAQPTVPPGLIEDHFPIKPGQPIVATRVEGAEAGVALALPQAGYPFAKVGQRDILIDRDTGEGVYTLPVDTGPRARFGSIRTTGNLAFEADHIADMARFAHDELYDSRQIDDLRKALTATGLFSAVSAVPQRTGEAAGEGTEYVDILVDQQAGPARTIAARAGYGTGEGLRVEGSWTHRNLFPPEGALIVSGVAGTLQQGLGVTFKRSNAGQRDRTFQLSAEVMHSDYNSLDSYTARIAGLMSRESTPIWQKKLTYAYGAQVLVTAEDDYDFTLGARNRRTFYIAGLTGELGLDLTNDLLDPVQGFRLTALVEPEASIESGFHPYVRTRLDGSAYFPVSDSLVLAARIGLGSIQGISRFDLAPSRRFYSGGGGSVRGYGYQKLGPQSPDGDAVGGRSFNEGSAEVRYRFGDYGVVAFADIGQSYADSLPQFSDLRMGAGIGARYYTNFGPLRFDVATPIGRRPGESWISVYISIGQSF